MCVCFALLVKTDFLLQRRPQKQSLSITKRVFCHDAGYFKKTSML